MGNRGRLHDGARRIRRLWALTLPLGGTLYGGMTVDSAVRHGLGRDRW